MIHTLLQTQFPIIAGPMFLVSDPELVANVSGAGALGAMPSLNWRTTQDFQKAVQEVKKRTSKPFGVNIIVNQANTRQFADLDVCVEERVPLVITSLGNPKKVIEQMHSIGSKVFCDVTDLRFAKKVEDLGADGVIAVCSGAGGHAGPISPVVLIPLLSQELKVPVVAAGGISTGKQILASFALGAKGVQIGTRFIATHESKVDAKYKEALLSSNPEDIVLTKKISGTPASVINTPYIQKVGLELNAIESFLHSNPRTKKWMKILRSYVGSEALRDAITKPTWKEVWSAGQGVAFIDSIKSASEVVVDLVNEYETARAELNLPQFR